MFGEPSLLLLRENDRVVGDDVELTLAAGLDLGIVVRFGIQLGRETRGPCVVAGSDGAVLNQDLRHDQNLSRRPLVAAKQETQRTRRNATISFS